MKAIQLINTNNEKVFPAPYFPIGSLFLSLNNTNPANYFGGTWELITDRFIVGAGNIYNVGSTGGEASHYHSTSGHTLTINEMPSHTHIQNAHNHIAFYNDGSYSAGWWSRINSQSYTNQTQSGTAFIGYTTATNQNTGGNASHTHGNTGSSNSMPPYIAVYMWKRTA